MADRRLKLLDRWAGSIIQAAQAGALDRGKPITIHSIEPVRGPRAGALECHAGLDTGRLLSVLSRDDFALHRQFVPWRFGGEPSVYLTSRYVRLEAAWPDDLAERDIKLADIGQHPKDGGRWIAGKNEVGATVTLGLSDTLPHFLFGGWTGSGKTWALRSALAQLSRDSANRLVLVDGKYGDGLACLGHLPNLAGPVAMDLDTARAALSWAVTEMVRRYRTGDKSGRVIVAIDEVQEFTGKSGDVLVTELVRKLTTQGRGAGVHLFIGTQHPVGDVFSDSTIRRNLPGRVALRTEDYKASEVVIGGPTPRADRLLGAGDSFIVTPNATRRAQLAYIPMPDLEAMNTSKPALSEWPEADPEAAGTLSEDAPRYQYDGDELAVSLVTAHENKGRPALVKALESAGLGRPGVEKAMRLLGLGRDMHTWLVVNDWCLSVCQRDTQPAGYEIAENGKVVSIPRNQTDRQGEGDE
jgi:hypothetical protein